MATQRDNPYGAFNYIVALGSGVDASNGDGSLGTIVGEFSDVSGLGMEVKYSDYRNGNERVNTVLHVNNVHSVDQVVLKRGLIGSPDLFAWLKTVRDGVADQRDVSITLLDEARSPVVTWRLRHVKPSKWTGPTLAAKGGGEVAMEELHLVHEGIEFL